MPQSRPDPHQLSPALLHWQAEAVRLRESNWAELDDTSACAAAIRACPRDFQQRILWRANALAAQSGLQKSLLAWQAAARWSLALLWLLAILAGASTALASLGNGRINLALALFGLLGFNTLSMLAWLLSYFVRGSNNSSVLASAWLALSRRIARGPDSLLLAQALVALLERNRIWTASVGLLSHVAWLLALSAGAGTLLIMLSTRQYSFYWETTLLAPENFITITQSLGALPGLLGFGMPLAEQIAASVGNNSPPDAAVQAAWSWWLLGCLVVWGLVPRAIALIFCLLRIRRKLSTLRLDTELLGFNKLRERLLPTYEPLGIDHPAPELPGAHPDTGSAPAASPQDAAVIAHELGADISWPPKLPQWVSDLGTSSSRNERAAIRARLAQPIKHLLLVCDARITPDRGSMAWFNELAAASGELRILYLGGSDQRRSTWQETLARHGLQSSNSIEQWLESTGTSSHE